MSTEATRPQEQVRASQNILARLVTNLSIIDWWLNSENESLGSMPQSRDNDCNLNLNPPNPMHVGLVIKEIPFREPPEASILHLLHLVHLRSRLPQIMGQPRDPQQCAMLYPKMRYNIPSSYDSFRYGNFHGTIKINQ